MMELNVTAGVFMVLMAAIAIAVLLCCCKAYVACKQRHLQLNDNLDEYDTSSNLHRHLPVVGSYNDEPPCYDDILTGKIPSSIATPDEPNAELKLNSNGIMVKLTYDNDDTESVAPPRYSCVIIERNDIDVPPPSYYQSKNSSINPTVSSENTSDKTFSRKGKVLQKVCNAFDAVSTFLSGAKQTNASTSDDPSSQISCDGNVMETPTSSSTTAINVTTTSLHSSPKQ